jgi:hypothetical protein
MALENLLNLDNKEAEQPFFYRLYHDRNPEQGDCARRSLGGWAMAMIGMFSLISLVQHCHEVYRAEVCILKVEPTFVLPNAHIRPNAIKAAAQAVSHLSTNQPPLPLLKLPQTNSQVSYATFFN